MRNHYWATVLLCIAFFILTGCGTAKTPVDAVRSAPAPAMQPPPSVVNAESPAAQVLIQFADLVSKGDVTGASELLTPELKGIYTYKEYAPIRNTPRMEILKLVDHSLDWRADTGRKAVEEARVFYLAVRYKVKGIIPSDFKDGEVYHHKAVVIKAETGKWLISELSSTGERE